VGDVVISVTLDWIPGKGIGPFVEQPSAEFRAVKSLEGADGVLLHIVTKAHLPPREKVRELSHQHSLDIQDLSEQTGFTQDELRKLS
jgi:hypothetical protein